MLTTINMQLKDADAMYPHGAKQITKLKMEYFTHLLFNSTFLPSWTSPLPFKTSLKIAQLTLPCCSVFASRNDARNVFMSFDWLA